MSQGAFDTQVRRGHAGDLDALLRVCRKSFRESLRWQLGGPAGRVWWRSVLQSAASETWVATADGEVNGLVVLVTDEAAWSSTRAQRRATVGQCLAAALRRPAALRTVLRRPPRVASRGSDPTRLPTPVGRRTWIELIAVSPRCRGCGMGTALLVQAESVTRRLNRSAIHLAVAASNNSAIRGYERYGFEVVHCNRKGLVLAKPLPGLEKGQP